MAVPQKINIELPRNSTHGYISKRTKKSGHVPCCLKPMITLAIILWLMRCYALFFLLWLSRISESRKSSKSVIWGVCMNRVFFFSFKNQYVKSLWDVPRTRWQQKCKASGSLLLLGGNSIWGHSTSLHVQKHIQLFRGAQSVPLTRTEVKHTNLRKSHS